VGMNHKSAKKLGSASGVSGNGARVGKTVGTLGARMGQGTGAVGPYKYEMLRESMNQAGPSGRQKFKIKKLGEGMNQ
jgi:hypothetical protein